MTITEHHPMATARALHEQVRKLTAVKDEHLATVVDLRASERQLRERLTRLRRKIKSATVVLEVVKDPTPKGPEIEQTMAWCQKHYPDDVDKGARRLSNLAAAKPIHDHRKDHQCLSQLLSG